MIRLILVLLIAILYLVIGCIPAFILWLIGKKNPDLKDRISRRMIQWIFGVLLFVSGTKVKAEGLENIPKDRAVLYVGNHRSYFDIITSYRLLPGITGYVAKKEMAKVIKADLLKIKKEYALPRKTQIEDAKAVVLEEKKVQEQEVMFIMDRFGYAKTIDMSAYERNKEAVHNENRYVFSCMNTDKICIFTDNGSLHQIKVLDIPFTRFRDKGTPIDNLGNYDSSGENILYLTPFEQLKGKKMLFMTKLGMAKLVDTSEFEVSKRTVAATKLQEDDLLVGIYVTDAVKEVFSRFSLDGEVKEEEMIVSSQHVIVQTAEGFFLRFPLSDVPEKKKGAVGVRAIKLTGKDTVEDVYLLTQGDELTIEYRGKNVDFARLKMAHRDTKGTKIRV